MGSVLGENKPVWILTSYCAHTPPNCLLVNGYGATECSWALYYTISHQDDIKNLNSIPLGKTTSNLEAIIDYEVTDDSKTGELCIHSNYISPGYWHNEKATKKAYTKFGSGKMYYRTGDIVSVDESGCYYFNGRLHWHEKIRGQRVNLHEIEDVMLNQFPLEECAVGLSPYTAVNSDGL